MCIHIVVCYVWHAYIFCVYDVCLYYVFLYACGVSATHDMYISCLCIHVVSVSHPEPQIYGKSPILHSALSQRDKATFLLLGTFSSPV